MTPPHSIYIDGLDDLATRAASKTPDEAVEAAIALALGTGPMTALRKSRSIERLRAGGTFFTSPELAERMWKRALGDLTATSVVVDPAVGAGDLLLPAVRRLRETGNIDAAEKVVGFDVDGEFIATTRRRLHLATGIDESRFSGVRVQDFFLSQLSEINTASHVVLNPPFVNVRGLQESRWGKGSVNAAAVFVERSLWKMRPGARLLAILPDVLRSGSRYSAWRDAIAHSSSQLTVEELGQFDPKTDVHVFVLDLHKRSDTEHAVAWPRATSWAGRCVRDMFEVHVGAVVPHRHADAGRSGPFATVQSIASWAEIEAIESRRAFNGRLDQGPFVLVRRTSRPGDAYRARASLYTGADAVAVENHFLVLTPRSGDVADCRQLMRVLRSARTTDHLDRTIRLRHLTVGAVGGIPWADHDQ